MFSGEVRERVVKGKKKKKDLEDRKGLLKRAKREREQRSIEKREHEASIVISKFMIGRFVE